MLELLSMLLIIANTAVFTLITTAYFLLRSKFQQYIALNADFNLAVTSIHEIHTNTSQKITDMAVELVQLRQHLAQLQLQNARSR